MRRQTYFKDEFRNVRILAIDGKSLRCLVTPEANQFLAQLEVKEITESHTCDTLFEIDTKATYLMLGGGASKWSIFDVMYKLKEWLACDFQFKVNHGQDSDHIDVMLACVLP